ATGRPAGASLLASAGSTPAPSRTCITGRSPEPAACSGIPLQTPDDISGPAPPGIAVSSAVASAGPSAQSTAPPDRVSAQATMRAADGRGRRENLTGHRNWRPD